MKSVYYALRTGSLNKAVRASSLKGLTDQIVFFLFHRSDFVSLRYYFFIWVVQLRPNVWDQHFEVEVISRLN
jgi:hypothetical protein